MGDEVLESYTIDKIADQLLDSVDIIVNQCQQFAFKAIPVVLPLMGICVVVGFGTKFFKSLAKK